MNRYEVSYIDFAGNESGSEVRAESEEQAKAYFSTMTPFVAMSAKYLGKDLDKDQAPKIGPS